VDLELPEPAGVEVHALEAGSPERPGDLASRVDVEAVGVTTQPLPAVQDPAGHAHPPGIARRDETESPAGAGASGGEQGCAVDVAADHLVERDEVHIGDVRRKGDEVSLAVIHPVGQTESRCLLPGRGEKRARRIDVDRAGGARLQETEMDGTDPAADVEHRRAGRPAHGQSRDEAPGRAAGAATPVLVQSLRGVTLVERFVVAATVSALHDHRSYMAGRM
jgi:hypothetical protein